MSTLYQILHDFAGPVATIIAAAVAVYVTWRLGSRQAEIARQQASTAQQQADIASMRLQYDLFEHRFRVYNATKMLLVVLQNESTLSLEALNEYMRSTADSIFLLDQSVTNYLDEVKNKAVDLRAVQQRFKDPQSAGQHADREAELLDWFHAQFRVLVEKFRPFLDVQESPLKRAHPT